MAAPKTISLTGADGTLQTFSSLSQACATLGQPYKQVHKRLQYLGWTPEEALGIQPIIERKKPVTLTINAGEVRHFASEREASRVLGVPYLVAYRRLRRGWTPEQAFGLVPPPRRKSAAAKEVAINVDGRIRCWPSLAEAALANSQTLSSVKSRLRSGWRMEEALGIHDSGRQPHRMAVSVVDGGETKSFESLTAAAKHYRLTVDLVYQRLRKLKWSLEESLGIVPRPEHERTSYGLIYVITHIQTGRQYVGQTKELCVGDRWSLHLEEANKKSRKSKRPITRAILEYGADAFKYTAIDDACSHAELNAKEVFWIKQLNTRVPHGFNATRGGQGLESGRSVVVGGVRYRTMTEASEAFGVPLSSASRWLTKGTPEQAFRLQPKPPRRSTRGQAINFSHSGIQNQYDSIRAAAKAHGVPEKKIQRRLKTGWSIEQALGLVARPSADQRKPVHVRIGGKVVTYSSRGVAAKARGLSVQTFLERLRRGWPMERALLAPAGRQGQRRKRRS
jgi:group I intron endonuclease